MEVFGKLNIRERQEGPYLFKTLQISSLFTAGTVSSVAIGKGESFSARVVGGPMREDGQKLDHAECGDPNPPATADPWMSPAAGQMIFFHQTHKHRSRARNT